MGMNAELFAIGKFQKKIVDCLDYPENYYECVKENTKIATLVHVCPTRGTSEDLFAAFGTEPWDFGSHWLGKLDEKIKDERLLSSLRDAGLDEDEISALKRLANAGFRFFLMPNG